MRKNPRSESGVFEPRVVLSLILCLAGISLAVISLAKMQSPPVRRLTLAIEKPLTPRPILAASNATLPYQRATTTPLGAPPPPNTPTFGHPIISGIGGVGFEQDLRLDPSNPNRLYTSAPGTASAEHQLDLAFTRWRKNLQVGRRCDSLGRESHYMQWRRGYGTRGRFGGASLLQRPDPRELQHSTLG